MDLNTYKLPMNVAAALATNRPEMIALGNVNLEPDDQREVLRLLCEMIADRQRQKEKLELLGQIILEAERTMVGNARKLGRAIEAFEKEETRDAMQAAVKPQKEEV